MTITLQSAIERDIGRVVIVLKDGKEIGRLSLDDFERSDPATTLRLRWIASATIDMDPTEPRWQAVLRGPAIKADGTLVERPGA